MAQRIRIYKPGSWDKLKLEEFECSEPGKDEIKIGVKAAGVNFADTIVRQGHYSSAKKFVGWPITPGFEVAGDVLAVGSSVKDFKVGDKVMAVTFFGGYSSEVVVRQAYVRLIPKLLSYTEAASIPAVFASGFYAVHWLARVHKGATALVHSAAGGVGLALLQILKDLDCKVVGVVGKTNKVPVAKNYGADVVINKTKQELWPAAEKVYPEGFDLIFEPNGLSTLKQSYNHLAKSGLLFVYGQQSILSKSKGKQNIIKLTASYLRTPRFNSFKMITDNKSVLGFNVSYLYEHSELIETFFDFTLSKLESKAFKPLPISVYDYKNVAQAHKDIESGKTFGKLVLTF